MIPLNRWASSTVNAVLAKYPGIDTSQPLGVIQSQAINPSGASTTTAGGPAATPATGQPGQPAPAPGGWAGQMAERLEAAGGGARAAARAAATAATSHPGSRCSSPWLLRRRRWAVP